MDPALWGLVGLIVMLFVSGFFTSARTALSRVRRQSLRDAAEEGNGRARAALKVAEDSFRVLSAFRLANLLAHFLTAGLVSALLVPAIAQWLAQITSLDTIASFAIVYIVMIPLVALLSFAIAESVPEMLVRRDPVAWAIALARPAQFTIALLSPLIALTSRLPQNVIAPLGDADAAALITEEEIMTLVDAGEEEGSIEQEEKEMIYSIFQLDETLAREIMVPRIDIIALEANTPLEEARQTIIEAGHSRIPVFEESLDRISGLLYAKDLLEVWDRGEESLDLAALLRPAPFVPESKRVSDLLHQLQTTKVHMAIVIDEYGGTAGLVTIEDIVEEIVGEIFDEYDEEVEAAYEALSSNEYLFDARIDLDDFNRLLETNVPTELGDTLGGYIYGQLGKVPEPGEIVEHDQLRIEVISVADRRIRRVRVELLSQEETSASETEHEQNGKPHVPNGNSRDRR